MNELFEAIKDMKRNIETILEDGGEEKDIREYIAVASFYLYNWSRIEMNYNEDGYFFVRLFWKDCEFGTITVPSITGVAPEEVDWEKEGF